VGVYLDASSQLSSTIKRLKEIPEIIESHYTIGNYAILIKVLCKDNEDLMRILNARILPIKSILRAETFVSLAQQIKRQVHV
jgi:Lrp/AsnC family transcriptional regulator for asnA, asnC and gidA